MLKFNAADFVRAVAVLSTMETFTRTELAQPTPRWKRDSVLKSKTIPRELQELAESVTALGASLSLKAINRLMDNTDAGRVQLQELSGRLLAIHNLLRDELSEGQALKHRVQYLNAKEPLFGLEVHACFGAAIDDIEEAGNCLATDNGTAAVFHLMRVMECGLKALGKELGIPYAPSWESYINQTPHPKRPRKVKKNLKFYKEILGDLQSVKFVWRNPTMHIDRKYSPDEAEEIFKSVRRFMQRLAAFLPARLKSVFG